MNKTNINKAARYYIFRSKDVILNFSTFFLIFLAYAFGLFKGIFSNREEEFVILLNWTLILGLTLIQSNSMIVDLTVKDKLTGRIEFLLASDIEIKDLIKAYSLEMWRLSSIIPYLIFFVSLILYDFETKLIWTVLIYLSTIMLSYFEILLFNIISLYRKNFKFFKNIVFFVTTALIYMVGSFSDSILKFLNSYEINITHAILAVNIGITIILILIDSINLKRIDKQSIIMKEGKWS